MRGAGSSPWFSFGVHSLDLPLACVTFILCRKSSDLRLCSSCPTADPCTLAQDLSPPFGHSSVSQFWQAFPSVPSVMACFFPLMKMFAGMFPLPPIVSTISSMSSFSKNSMFRVPVRVGSCSLPSTVLVHATTLTSISSPLSSSSLLNSFLFIVVSNCLAIMTISSPIFGFRSTFLILMVFAS